MKKSFSLSPFELQVITWLTAEEKTLTEIKEISPAGCLSLTEIITLLNTESTAKSSLIQVANPIFYKKTKLKTTQYNHLLFEQECKKQGLHYSNIAQGKFKNCWFLAALGAILLHPQGSVFIASMMRDLSQLIEIEVSKRRKLLQ